jgi:hypothetical protein
VACEDEKSNTCQGLVEKPEGARQLASTRSTRTVIKWILKNWRRGH